MSLEKNCLVRNIHSLIFNTSNFRLKPGNPGLIILYNTNEVTETVNLEPFLGKVETVTVVLLSDKYNEEGVAIK